MFVGVGSKAHVRGGRFEGSHGHAHGQAFGTSRSRRKGEVRHGLEAVRHHVCAGTAVRESVWHVIGGHWGGFEACAYRHLFTYMYRGFEYQT